MVKQDDKEDLVMAMLKEVQDHESRMYWTFIHRSEMPPNAKTILSIWSFKRKRFPDGNLMKHKATLRAHGGCRSGE